MKKIKFYEQVNFYLAAITLIIAIIALGLYAANCASEFNGGVVSKDVVTGDIIAAVFAAIAAAASIAQTFLQEDSLLYRILNYRRFCMYIAFIALLYSFLMGILAEYSLIGTILYPIVSGTVGDPVDPVLSGSYFTSLILTFVAFIIALVSGLLMKGGFYKAEKKQDIESQEVSA